METLNSLNERMNTLEKVPNESSNTKSSDTVEVNNKENSNTYQKQEQPVLINSNDTTTDFVSKFKQLMADLCEVTYSKKGITSMYR